MRGDDEERLGQIARFTADGDAAFLHRFQQRGLCLGRGAVHFISEDEICEDGAGLVVVVEPAILFLQHLGADDVARHKIGGELNPPKTQVQNVTKRADNERLRETGHTDEQAMAAREKAREHQPHDRFLTDDDLVEFLGDAPVKRADFLRRDFVHSSCGLGVSLRIVGHRARGKVTVGSKYF